LLAEALGDVDVQYVWRFLRSHKIDLAARKSWCESNDPNFTAKAANVVGLYAAPPEKAIVLCVDEKPSIQALERAGLSEVRFMNSVTAACPNRQLHVVLDNLNTHKKNEHWLKDHPNVQFHFTPTSASWLNQVEVWFSILQGQSPQRHLLKASNTSRSNRCLHQRNITSKLSPSFGPRKRSVKADSKAAVSLSSDSGSSSPG
jgi:hypothetical protein